MAIILLVEDNPVNQELATDLLEIAGHEVVPADTAEEGIRLARERHPDLILMDVRLPGMDGLTATEILKGDPATRTIPVVALTAQAMSGDAEKALTAGCDAYITKPIDTRQFTRSLAEILAARGAPKPEAES